MVDGGERYASDAREVRGEGVGQGQGRVGAIKAKVEHEPSPWYGITLRISVIISRRKASVLVSICWQRVSTRIASSATPRFAAPGLPQPQEDNVKCAKPKATPAIADRADLASPDLTMQPAERVGRAKT